MSLRTVLAAAGLLAGLLAPSQGSAETELHFFDIDNNEHDVFLWPLNAHLGGGAVGDSSGGTGAFSLGVDVLRFSYKNLVVDSVSMRMLFRDNCVGGPNCGIGADFYVGPRAFYAAYLDDERDHRVLFGGGAGWGSLGGGFSGRLSGADDQLLFTAAVAYEFAGLLGLEVALLLPATNVGDRYPAAVTVNVLGLGLLLAALYGS